MTFGQRLTQARKDKNFTQEELANKLNLSRQTISRWEKNQVFPDISNLKAAVQILGVSFNELLDEGSNDFNTTDSPLDYLMDKVVKLVFFDGFEDDYIELVDKELNITDINDGLLQAIYFEKGTPYMRLIQLNHIALFRIIKGANNGN